MSIRDLLLKGKKKVQDRVDDLTRPASLQKHESVGPLSLMPETIDFSALWDEPQDAGSLQQILMFVNTGLLGVLVVMSFF